MIRLDKFLADAGAGSRSDVKKFIKNGRVRVNGAYVHSGEQKIDEKADSVLLDGKEAGYKKFHYIMLNKPAGVVSATEDSQEKTVIDLLYGKYKNLKLFPVGRLDKDTTGLLILTNDGQFAHNTLSPGKHVVKTYTATVRGFVDDSTVESFRDGVELGDGYMCQSAELHVFNAGEISHVLIKIKEGKYHQIKRMFAALSMEVLALRRVGFGGILLDESLAEGEYRELIEAELALIRSACSPEPE